MSEDDVFIDMSEPKFVAYWCTRFRVPESELRAAISMCGPYAATVAMRLGRPTAPAHPCF